VLSKWTVLQQWNSNSRQAEDVYSNIHVYPTRCNVTQFTLSGNCYTCFGWYHHPSSGAQTTVSTASGICHTVTATCRYSAFSLANYQPAGTCHDNSRVSSACKKGIHFGNTLLLSTECLYNFL
jgi:hypothetical protein